MDELLFVTHLATEFTFSAESGCAANSIRRDVAEYGDTIGMWQIVAIQGHGKIKLEKRAQLGVRGLYYGGVRT